MISMEKSIITEAFAFDSFDVDAFVTIFSEMSILSLNWTENNNLDSICRDEKL